MSSDDPIAKQLEIRYDVERRLDVDALEKSVTLQNLRNWMRCRFQRDDKLVPINNDQLEVPHYLFVDLWCRSIENSNIREHLNQASADLAHEAWRAKSLIG